MSLNPHSQAVDYFRKVPDKPAPLVCFLSHVHSDHLQGLESLRSPFIYCSAVSRELLLRLEKYPHRMNFSKGILEARKQHYGHLAKILRPIPLNTPTEIELTPLQRIRVTLLDANHCAGAVMFLIEGQGKAILYTGDIRAESWWVNSLTRHPALVPYACGLKTLDNIYLDTTFAVKSNIYRYFPSKAEGVKELLEQVQRYPKDTIFYLRAWTFGYEEVWQALSAFLDSKVHVDRYQYSLYKSLASRGNGTPGFDTTTFLCGFQLGNEFVPGCLTSDDSVRIHSCEPGVFCKTMKSKKSVYITPIVTRDNRTGIEVPEIGAGGGKRDLYQIHELELPDELTLRKLESLLSEHIKDESALSQTKELLRLAFMSKHRALSLDEFGLADDADISLKDLASMLSTTRGTGKSRSFEEKYPDITTITFPYSRHSSYAELCELVQAFKPKDVFPCTVDGKNWNESVSIEGLFGHLCSRKKFVHDRHMRGARGEDILAHESKRARYTIMREARLQLQAMGDKVQFDIGPMPRDANEVLGEESQSSYQTTTHSSSEKFTREDDEVTVGSIIHTNDESQTDSELTTTEAKRESQQTISDLLGDSQEAGSEAYQNRVRAYRAALKGTWNELSLVSAGENHAEEEVEL
ncbi:DNA repair protein, putative [Talaromyces stipitatus ATCC 10500]|uniref:Protein artemis n=1 Tax=Talaromyces stipitatus (strain ATCC 10500 / CBS 375.48 / QM 6759 / NRRL 1006) TaxID=441959 RepID=B8MGP0_TALSN|nr:DNA repair protein, putative [Talaromyces stipitatus ATCC 10500]EED16791.1 DNA repair protein, putative [Talaromyces stipitatus ATCC 10500]